MNAPIVWHTLPDSGARALFTGDSLPLLWMPSPADEHNQSGLLELEARYGWRIQTTTLTNQDSPDGWLMAVDWCGTLAQPMGYDEIKRAPIQQYDREPEGVRFGHLTGMDGVSICHRLSGPWRGHPAGTWVVWRSHPGAVGFVYRVGGTQRAARLLAEVVTHVG